MFLMCRARFYKQFISLAIRKEYILKLCLFYLCAHTYTTVYTWR